jgi:hypothetical protein
MIQIHIHHGAPVSPSREPDTIDKLERELSGHPQSDNARLLFLSGECCRLKELLHKAEARIRRTEFTNTVLKNTMLLAANLIAAKSTEAAALKSDIASRDASRTQLHELLRAKDAEIATLTKSNAELMTALQRSQRAD